MARQSERTERERAPQLDAATSLKETVRRLNAELEGLAAAFVAGLPEHRAPEDGDLVRLVTAELDPNSQQPKGILQAAYGLQDRHGLADERRRQLADHLSWFESNLSTPDRFVRTRSKGYYRREPVAISWFKVEAEEHVARATALARLVADEGMAVHTLRTAHPGYVVYEDAHQVVAVPFRDR